VYSVNPGGTEKIELTTSAGVEITALPDEFTAKSSYMITKKDLDQPANDTGGEAYQDTLYYAANKKDARVFYNWLVANKAEASRMDIGDLRKLWRAIGVSYDYH